MPHSDSARPEIQRGTEHGGSGSAHPSRAARALATVADMAASPIIGVDIDGVVTLFNSAAEVLTGWPLGEITGRPLWERLLEPEDTARFQALLGGLAAKRSAIPRAA